MRASHWVTIVSLGCTLLRIRAPCWIRYFWSLASSVHAAGGPEGQGRAVSRAEVPAHPPLPPLLFPGPPTLPAPARGPLTLHRDPIDSPGNLWLGPALHLTVQAGSLPGPVQVALGLVQPVRGSCEEEESHPEPTACSQFCPSLTCHRDSRHRRLSCPEGCLHSLAMGQGWYPTGAAYPPQ